MSYTTSKRWRGLTMSVYWRDGSTAIHLSIGSLTAPDSGTQHCLYLIHGDAPSIPSVEDLIATAVATLDRLQAERGTPRGVPTPPRPRWIRRHASGIPSGDHRGGRARWA